MCYVSFLLGLFCVRESSIGPSFCFLFNGFCVDVVVDFMLHDCVVDFATVL